jgi:membrane associated rhomboid family serine protease
VLFHASIFHVVFNMLALVPIGSALERVMGTVRFFHVILLLITSNGIIHVALAFLAAHNPIYPNQDLSVECGIGFSGVIFALIVIETSLSGTQHRRFAFKLTVCNEGGQRQSFQDFELFVIYEV